LDPDADTTGNQTTSFIDNSIEAGILLGGNGLAIIITRACGPRIAVCCCRSGRSRERRWVLRWGGRTPRHPANRHPVTLVLISLACECRSRWMTRDCGSGVLLLRVVLPRRPSPLAATPSAPRARRASPSSPPCEPRPSPGSSFTGCTASPSQRGAADGRNPCRLGSGSGRTQAAAPGRLRVSGPSLRLRRLLTAGIGLARPGSGSFPSQGWSVPWRDFGAAEAAACPTSSSRFPPRLRGISRSRSASGPLHWQVS
jgi:hypothetical protein